MVETLATVHSIVRWFVLAGLLAGVVFGFVRASQAAVWTAGATRMFIRVLVLLDVQVLIGIVLWISGRGWELNVFRAWIHPVGMLVGLGVGHALVGRAKTTEGPRAFRLSAVALMLVVAIVVLSIPRDGWL